MNTPSSLLSKLLRSLEICWDFLTRPRPAVLPDEQRRARLLSGLLLAVTLVLLVETIAHPGGPILTLSLSLIAYLASRTRFSRYSSVLLVAILSIDPYYRILLHAVANQGEVTSTLVWVLLPMVLCSLFFSIPAVAAVCVLHLVAMLLLPLVKPEVPFASLGAALPFAVVLSVIILLVQRERELLEQHHQVELRASREEMVQSYDDTLRGWAGALELREQEVQGHSWRVVDLTVDLARRMGVPESEIPSIRRGALLHDIGKMGIPDKILLKPGSLSEEEWQVMRQHTAYAARFLEGIPYLQPAMAIPCHHHERWDGSGYPDGLAGEQIPLPARIFAVVDSWDALLSDRPYRDAWPREHALRYIRDKAGMHFDPKVVEVFLKMVS
jgi:hypothetical protein